MEPNPNPDPNPNPAPTPTPTPEQVVGIGGKDIAEGLPKLTLAVVWQLMRADVLQFLESLGFDEKDILKWANRKAIEARRPDLQISGFRDKSIRNGLFLNAVLGAVDP